MDFCFYPRHEYACPQTGHCPHLGGAALSTLKCKRGQNDLINKSDPFVVLAAPADAPTTDDQTRSLASPLDPERGIVTTYTYDEHARLIAVSEPGGATVTIFAYPDASHTPTQPRKSAPSTASAK